MSILSLKSPDGDAPVKPPSRRAALGALFAGGYALAPEKGAAQTITTPTDGLVLEEVKFAGHAGYQLPAYVARPATKKRAPAVIVVNEIFGIHAYIKDVCHRLARLGYVAIAPDYFDRAGDPATLTDFAAIRPIVAATGAEQVLGDTQGAIAWLKSQRFVAGRKIAITGFCWGGTVVWLAAARFAEIKAGAAWYGRLAPASRGSSAIPKTNPAPLGRRPT